MKTFDWSVAVLLALGAGACGTRIVYTPTNAPPHALQPKPPEQVEVYSASPPQRKYIEVGLIEARRESGWSVDDETAVQTKLRQDAAERGCDAIVITGSADAIVGDHNSTTTLRGYRATCIVWDGEPTPKAASVPRCVPGESKACVGPGGCQGGQACEPGGESYSRCDCGSNQ